MIEIILPAYLLAAFYITLSAMLRFPPKLHERTPEEWLIGLVLCWLIWPAALADLLWYKPK